MKKVLMSNEEQTISSTHVNQSNDFMNMDIDSSSNTQNDIYVRNISIIFIH